MNPRQLQWLVMAVLLGSSVLVQMVLLGRLPIPGPPLGLVCSCVIAIGLVGGQRAGAAAGFTAGLLLDVLPPATTTLGVTALCLWAAGAAAGRVRDPRGLAPAQVAGLLAGLSGGVWLVGQTLLFLLGDPTAPWWWLPCSVVGTTVIGMAVVPAVGWSVRRVGPQRHRRRNRARVPR